MIAVIGFIPFPMNVDEVARAEAAAHESVRPEWGGFVTDIRAHDHQILKGPVRDTENKITTPGDVILVAHDPELDKDIASTEFKVRYYEDKLRADRSTEPAMVDIDLYQLGAVQNQLNELEDRRAS